MIGSHIDISVRKQAEQQFKQQLQHLAALHEIDRAITSGLGLHRTLNIILENVVAHLHVDAAVISLFNPHLDTLEFAAERGFCGRSITQLSLQLGEGYAGQVALERRLVAIPNLNELERPFKQAYFTKEEGFVAYYGVPLIAKGQVKGVLEAFYRAPFVPVSDWPAYLEIMAEQTAIAIDNAQLFDGLQRAYFDRIRTLIPETSGQRFGIIRTA